MAISRPAADPAAPAGRRAPKVSGLVLRHLRPDRRSALALAAAVAAMTVLPLLAPQLTRRFVDDALGGAGAAHLTWIAAVFLAVAVAGQAARLCTAWLASRLAWDGSNRLRERLAEHTLGLDMDFHGRHTPGEMVERVDGDVVAVSDFAVAFLLDIVASLLLLLGMLGVVFGVDWRLAVALVVYCALAGFGMSRAQRLAVPSATRSRQAGAELMGHLEERLAGTEDLRANGAGEHTVRRFRQVSSAWYHAERRGAAVGTRLIAGTSVAFAAGTALVLALAAWFGRSGALTAGTAVLLFQYTLMVRAPFERLIEQLRQYQDALAGVTRIGTLLAVSRTLPVPTAPRPLPPTGPLDVRLDGVDFAYADDDEQVLSGITLTLAPGETLGLVGRTGSGKTTIARLLLRLYDPTGGTVRVGGRDLRDVAPEDVRRRITAVTQDVQLFSAGLRDNLTLFRQLADDATLTAVLAEVGLGDWLAGLPDGLDTELGGGARHGVSAGEAQLLAFARAFLADPGFVVLDEASSRLDPATDRHIEDCIERLLTGRTGILIAHRLSSLSRVDKIAVIDDGRIVEYGRRADLVADPDSRFARMLDMAGAQR